MRCQDKKAYEYYLDAGNVVGFLKKQGVRQFIYLCSECDMFHLSKKLLKTNTFSRADFKDMGLWEKTK